MLEAKDILQTTQKGNVLFERNNTSKEIVGIVVAKVENEVVWIGPLATRPKFQVIKSGYSIHICLQHTLSLFEVG